MVTVVIPTYNRHRYLKRLLEYFKGCNSCRIIVADSTETIFSNRDDYNISYFHLPELGFAEKMVYVYELIDTPYAVICADDDFIIPEAIDKCVEFLERNNDYSSCSGNSITFYTEYLKKHDFVSLDINSHKEYDKELLTDRLQYHFDNYFTLMYSVHRTEIMQSFLKDFSNIKQPFIREVAQSFYLLIHGKNKVHPFFYSARECMKGESEGQTNDNLNLVLATKRYENEVNSFYEKISALMVNLGGISNTHNVKILIDNSIKSYLEMCIPRKESKIKSLFKYLLDYIRYLKKKKNKEIDLVKILQFDNDSKNISRWNEIENVIVEFKI